MKLFLSALLLAAAPLLLAQNQAPSPSQQTAQRADGPGILADNLVAHMAARVDQTGCPLFLQSASVASAAGFLPVDARENGSGTLSLHFRNQSGKPIHAASITAHLRIKTDIYDLDAHPLDLRLTLSGTQDLDKTLDQFQRIVLPQHLYLFGVAQVTLDQVTFADGAVWTAAQTHTTCATTGAGTERIAR